MAYLGTKTGGRGVFISSDFNSISYIGDGSTTGYVLPEIVISSDESVLVHIDGIKQHISAYSVSGTLLTFTAAPPNTSNIEIIIFGVKSADTVTAVNPDSISIMELNTPDGTVGQVLTTDGSGNLSFSSKSTETLTSMGVTSTAAELNYVSGVTSAIQTQLGTMALKANDLSDLASASTARTNLGLVIGTNVQAFDAQLTDVAALTPTDGNFIVGDGTNFVAESAGTARTSLGLGTASTLNVGTALNEIVQLDGTAKLPAVDGSQLTGVDSLPTQTSQSGKFLTTDGSAASWSPPASDWTTIYDHSVDGDTTWIDFTTSESASTLKGFDIRFRNVTPNGANKLFLYPLNSDGTVNNASGQNDEHHNVINLQSNTNSYHTVISITETRISGNYDVSPVGQYTSPGATGQIQISYNYQQSPLRYAATWLTGFQNSNQSVIITGTMNTKSTSSGNIASGKTLGGFRLGFASSTIKRGFVEVRVVK